jgi:DNA-binding GntR family transcriptional regulator
VDQTYEVILNALCDGTLKSGERLTQEEIAARLNVSRQPVTHALSVLKSQGFVVPSGRLTVTPMEPRFFEAIYQFRSAVEPLAVRLATPRLTKQSIARGRSLIKHGRNLIAVGDRLACLQAGMDFHLFIYELAGNPLILETMRLYWRHVQRAMGQVLATFRRKIHDFRDDATWPSARQTRRDSPAGSRSRRCGGRAMGRPGFGSRDQY